MHGTGVAPPLNLPVDGPVKALVGVHTSWKEEKAGANAGRGLNATSVQERDVPITAVEMHPLLLSK
jgi:hypothetical protein